MKKAVVFDISGTLLERFRAVRSIKTGKISKKGSLDLIDQHGNSALVVLQTDTKKAIMHASPNESIYDFIINNDIKIDISYSSSNITKEEILKKIKNDTVTMKEFQEVARFLKKEKNYMQFCSGSAFIFDVNHEKIAYIIAAGGQIFPKVKYVISHLKKRDIDVFIASGDRAKSLYEIGEMVGIPKENIFDTANTKGKQKIITELKKKYKVMMVGNGPNDILAFQSADIAVVTLEQKELIPEEVLKNADIVINNITDLLNVNF